MFDYKEQNVKATPIYTTNYQESMELLFVYHRLIIHISAMPFLRSPLCSVSDVIVWMHLSPSILLSPGVIEEVRFVLLWVGALSDCCLLIIQTSLILRLCTEGFLISPEVVHHLNHFSAKYPVGLDQHCWIAKGQTSHVWNTSVDSSFSWSQDEAF